MRRLAKVALLFAFGVLPAVCMAKGQKSVIPCARAAFSVQGDLVAVTANGHTLDLEITHPGGGRESGRATIRTDQYGDVDCSVFVSGDGSLAAAVTRVPLENPESVRVWDPAAEKWQSSFELAPKTGLEGRIRVLGFWKGGHDLAVESDKLLDSSGIKQAIALALVDTRGSVVAGPRPEEPVGALDIERGASWVGVPGSPTDCSRTALSFTSNNLTPIRASTDAPQVPCSCFAGGLHGFAADGFPVGAMGRHDGIGTWVWSCAPTGNLQKLSLLSPKKQFLDRWVESGPAGLEVSPHGKFFVVVAQVTRWSWFDTQRAEWDELHIFQASPFRKIGQVGPIKGCQGIMNFALGDADGKAHVAVNWCGKWTVETMSTAVPVSPYERTQPLRGSGREAATRPNKPLSVAR